MLDEFDPWVVNKSRVFREEFQIILWKMVRVIRGVILIIVWEK